MLAEDDDNNAFCQREGKALVQSIVQAVGLSGAYDVACE